MDYNTSNMSLVADYGNSSDSGSCSNVDTDSENESKSETEEKKPVIPSQKLPTPNFGETKVEDEINSSVFKNPFIEAENEKEAILQKHVKMVDTKDNTMVINGKKICWNYRKGRCRFGHNCKFAHDSDIQKTDVQLKAEKEAAIQNSVVCQRGQMGHSQFTAQPIVQEVTQIKEGAIENKKRKRPGLTQGLVPGKKVMSHYLKNRKT